MKAPAPRTRNWLLSGLALLLLGSVAVLAAFPRKGVTTRSDEAYELYARGLQSWSRYLWDAADSAWAAAVALDPEFAMAWGRRAGLALQRGQVAEARECIQRAEARISHISHSERILIQLYRAEIDRDKEATRRLTEGALKSHPKDLEMWFCRYHVLLLAGDRQGAVDCLHRILELDPACLQAYNFLGYLQADMGNTEEALDALRRYAFVDTDQPNPHDSLGELYERIGFYEKADAEYRAALEADSTFFWSRIHLSRSLLSQGRFREAMAVTRHIPGGCSPVSRQWLRMGNYLAHVGAGDHAGALRLLEAMRDSLLQPVRYFYYRAEVLQALGDRIGAEAMRDSFLTALAERGESIVTSPCLLKLSLQAMSDELQGRWGAAADSLGAYVDREYVFWDLKQSIQCRRSEDLYRAGRCEEAVTCAEQVLGTNPAEPKALYWKARALDRLGRTAEAVTVWERLLQALEWADPGVPMREEAARRLSQAAAASAG